MDTIIKMFVFLCIFTGKQGADFIIVAHFSPFFYTSRWFITRAAVATSTDYR